MKSIKKLMTVVCFLIGLHKKKAPEGLKGLTQFVKMYPNIIAES